jgi:hypothetical protein
MFKPVDLINWKPRQIRCPIHGTHEYTIDSTIPGYEGHWCQICWIESLGPSLPLVEQTDDN